MDWYNAISTDVGARFLALQSSTLGEIVSCVFSPVMAMSEGLWGRSSSGQW